MAGIVPDENRAATQTAGGPKFGFEVVCAARRARFTVNEKSRQFWRSAWNANLRQELGCQSVSNAMDLHAHRTRHLTAHLDDDDQSRGPQGS
jgi:hypothetical protein